MHVHDPNQRPGSGPFGMGWQEYLVIGVVILATALFAATRRDWTSMLVSALILPPIVFALLHVLTRFWQGGARPRQS
jgi:glucose dehydrogenase